MHFMEIDKRILVEEFKLALAHSSYLRSMVDASSVTLEVTQAPNRHGMFGVLRFEMSPSVRSLG